MSKKTLMLGLSLAILTVGTHTNANASCEGGIVDISVSGTFTVIKVETPKYSCKLDEKSNYREKYLEVIGPGCVVELNVKKMNKTINKSHLPIKVYVNQSDCAFYKIGQLKKLTLSMRDGECCGVLENGENLMQACTDGPNPKFIKIQSAEFHRCLGAESSWVIK